MPPRRNALFSAKSDVFRAVQLVSRRVSGARSADDADPAVAHRTRSEREAVLRTVTERPVAGGRILGGSSVSQSLSTAFNVPHRELLTCGNRICPAQSG